MEIITADTARRLLQQGAPAFPGLRDNLIQAANAALTHSLDHELTTARLDFHCLVAPEFALRNQARSLEDQAHLAKKEAQHTWRQFQALLRRAGYVLSAPALDVHTQNPIRAYFTVDFSFAAPPPKRA